MAVLIIGDNKEQTQKALQNITVCVGKKPDEAVLEVTKKKLEIIKQAFEITKEEVNATQQGDKEKAIINLVIERVALLATQL